jgi:hypothetical protein
MLTFNFPPLMLIDNGNVARFQEKTATAVYSAFCAIAGTMVFKFSAAAIGVLCWISKINMAFWYIVGIWHIHTRRSGKQ